MFMSSAQSLSGAEAMLGQQNWLCASEHHLMLANFHLQISSLMLLEKFWNLCQLENCHLYSTPVQNQPPMCFKPGVYS